MNTKETLLEAKNLISDIRFWTQGELAKDDKGGLVHPSSDAASSFCSAGALMRASRGSPVHLTKGYAHLSEAAKHLGHASVAALNDRGNHRLVMLMFDRAIGNLENQEIVSPDTYNQK
jgi:hypothetical protein